MFIILSCSDRFFGKISFQIFACLLLEGALLLQEQKMRGVQAIFGELFLKHFAALLLQEQDERMSGDCLGTFFLKFRGPAVVRAR